ncbi:MAG: hypothetical protein CMJ37_01605 [Phycisphaerae bacterium]|nr:hypothetical protein [Phycisphaerae bacterium]
MEFLIGFIFGVVLLKATGFGAVSVAEVDPNTPKRSTTAMVRSSAEPRHRDAMLTAELMTLLENDLTVTEKLILTMYYYENLTLKEISKTLVLPESRVRQLHVSISSRLKSYFQQRLAGNDKFRNFYPRNAWFRLSYQELLFVVLYYVRELPIQEIARVMKLSESETIDLYCAISRRLNDSFPFEEE